MADITTQVAPIIPVIDVRRERVLVISDALLIVSQERLAAPTTASPQHKAKVAEYNELLEVVYQRELELTGIKSTLAEMREMIAQEARIVDGTPTIAQEAGSKSDSESDIDAEHVLSDTSSEKAIKPFESSTTAVKKVAKKNKKPKGSRRSKVPNVELGGDWDYQLEGRGSRPARESEEEESDAEVLV